MTTEQIREFCLLLPGVAESIKWEDHLCFTIGEKMFCITSFSDESNVSIKTSEENFILLTEREGIIPAPYLARNKWVSINKRNSLNTKEWKLYLEDAYNIIKSKLPKKTIAAIEAAAIDATAIKTKKTK